MTLQLKICFHCGGKLTHDSNLGKGDLHCRPCMGPDGFSNHLSNIENGELSYLSLYFQKEDIGINIRHDDNSCAIFKMYEFGGINTYTDKPFIHHKIIVDLDYIPELDFSSREAIINQLRIYTVFS